MLQIYKKKHGQVVANEYLSLINRFKDFGVSILEDASTALDKQGYNPRQRCRRFKE